MKKLKGMIAAAVGICMIFVLVIGMPLEVFARAPRTVTSCDGLDIRYNDGYWMTYKGNERVSYTGVAKNKYGWWYCRNGIIDFSYSGVASNNYGSWVIDRGRLNRKANGFIDINGTKTAVVDGQVKTNYTGLMKGNDAWYYLKRGAVDWSCNGLVPNDWGWWVVSGGKIDFGYNGVYWFHNIPYVVTDGRVTGVNGKKIIYLTFDDGPYKYTDQLLDILNKYHIKATFFVTNAYPSYRYCIRKENEFNHQVAVHTYTHNYKIIYSSTGAYWNDFNKMNDIVFDQTGEKTSMFRFPGGSSNTVSRSYCRGVMSSLTSQANSKGYKYYDWNVSSGDAGETTSSSGVYNNLVRGVRGRQYSVVLCHDVKSYTVNAMDSFISWALKNGYCFMPLTTKSPTAHQRVAN